jgi:predicted PurR-regulated permease PerM
MPEFPQPVPAAPSRPTSATEFAVVGSAIGAVLYFARAIFIPLALAVLLSFALAPLARAFRRIGTGRVGSVLIVVCLAFLLIVSAIGVVVHQLAQMGPDLPHFQVTISEKIRSVTDAMAHWGPLGRAAQTFDQLSQEVSKLTQPLAPSTEGGVEVANQNPAQPLVVKIAQGGNDVISILTGFLMPLLDPLLTAGLVAVFVVFILLQREDLRDRLIRLLGPNDLQRTTALLDDAAARLSRYFLAQVAINGCFGIIISTGLWKIGLPSPGLWGAIAAVMRFVPFVGPFIAAAFPAAVAVAVDSGWTMAFWTIALFAISEPVVGQVVEPWVFGHSTGISPVAVVAALMFWTWLWGPVGFVLSTPLTVCLVALARHTYRLQFIEVLLGNAPALSLPERFYQRMLAGDPDEATLQAEQVLKHETLSKYFDEVALQGLQLALQDAKRGVLDSSRLEQIRHSVEALLENLSDHEDGSAIDAQSTKDSMNEGKGGGEITDEWRHDAVLCVSGRSPLDEAAAKIFGQLLRGHGMGVLSVTYDAVSRSDAPDARLIFLSFLGDRSRAPSMRFTLQRLRRKFPDVPIMIGAWLLDDQTATQSLGDGTAGEGIVTTLTDAVDACLSRAQSSSPVIEHAA